MKIKKLSSLLLCSFCLLLLSSCRLYNLEKNLEPKDREWLSIVRFTITPEERKIFLELPSSDREKFKEEFWKKRDPDPETEENIFKVEYLRRVNYANDHFIGGGRAGYLQDRGRIYILFGPPSQISRYPGGTPPYEIWYYGMFPITFVDRYNSGDYQMVTTNIGILHEINTALETLRKGQEKQISQYLEGKAIFDINLKIEKDKEGDAFLSVEIPYRNIWFQEKDNVLETALELSFEIFNSDKVKIWQFRKDYPISMTEEELQEKMEESHFITVPLSLNEGKYSLLLEIINKTGGEKLRKILNFSILS